MMVILINIEFSSRDDSMTYCNLQNSIVEIYNINPKITNNKPKKKS